MSRCEECDGLRVPEGASDYWEQDLSATNAVDLELLRAALPDLQLKKFEVRTLPEHDAAALELIRAASPSELLLVLSHETSVQTPRDLLIRGLAEYVTPKMFIQNVLGSTYAWDVLLLALAASREIEGIKLSGCNVFACTPGTLRAAMLNPTLKAFIVSGDKGSPTQAHVEAIKDAVRLSESMRTLLLERNGFSRDQGLEIVRAVAETAKIINVFRVGERGELDQEGSLDMSRVGERAREDIEVRRMLQAPGRATRLIDAFAGKPPT